MVAFHDLGQTYADRLGFLMRWSGILASSLDKRQVFDRLARAAVPYLADWCSIIVKNGRGLTRVGVAHVDPGIDRELHTVAEDAQLPHMEARLGIPQAIRTGESELPKKIRVADVVRELSGGVPDPRLV